MPTREASLRAGRSRAGLAPETGRGERKWSKRDCAAPRGRDDFGIAPEGRSARSDDGGRGDDGRTVRVGCERLESSERRRRLVLR